MRLRAWLRLARIALAPTVVWDLCAGALIAARPFDGEWALTLAAVLLLYHAGMILNDFADRGIDARHRSRRPLPSGAVPPPAALVVGLLLLFAALGLALVSLPRPTQELLGLLAVVILLYDFGGPVLRRGMGPILLAVARGASLLAAGIATLSRDPVLLWPAAVYACYFLFLSRLATHEESGVSGMRALSFVLMSALTPFLLFQGNGSSPSLGAGALLFALWTVLPALPDRHLRWEAKRVQSAVRRGLLAAPGVPALALLGTPAAPAAAGALLVMGLGVLLARAFPPE